MTDPIVCGWYTHDYAHWLPPLKASLQAYGHPSDFVQVAKWDGGWEANTRMKPSMMLAAMRKHRGRTIVFLDVDCVVRGSLQPLRDYTYADVALYLHAVRRKSKGYRMHARSGTMVLRPTEGAKAFVERWQALAAEAQHGDVDQTSLVFAMASSPLTTFQPLEDKWCGIKGNPDAVILHDQASKDVHKIGTMTRLWHRIKYAA